MAMEVPQKWIQMDKVCFIHGKSHGFHHMADKLGKLPP